MALPQIKKPPFGGMGLGCGERGIRTLDTVSRIHTFQACSFNHSDTSPWPCWGCEFTTKSSLSTPRWLWPIAFEGDVSTKRPDEATPSWARGMENVCGKRAFCCDGNEIRCWHCGHDDGDRYRLRPPPNERTWRWSKGKPAQAPVQGAGRADPIPRNTRNKSCPRTNPRPARPLDSA